MAEKSTTEAPEAKIVDDVSLLLRHRLKRHLDGVIKANLVKAFHDAAIKKTKVPKKVSEDETPTNCVGAGQIATFDPMLFVNAARRKRPQKTIGT